MKICIIVGTSPIRILEGAKEMINIKRNWVNPFGEGSAAKRIIEHIKNENIKTNNTEKENRTAY